MGMDRRIRNARRLTRVASTLIGTRGENASQVSAILTAHFWLHELHQACRLELAPPATSLQTSRCNERIIKLRLLPER